MRRREFIGRSGLIGEAASTLFGRGSSAQSVPKRPLIGWAGAAPAGTPAGANVPQFILDLTFGNFVKGVSEFGYEQGRNINIIKRFDMFTGRVATMEEVVALVKPDIIAVPTSARRRSPKGDLDDTDCLWSARGRGSSRLDCQRCSPRRKRDGH